MKRILVAEDNESNFLLIKYSLKDYEVVSAINGAEAVEMATSQHFDLILMDLKMPVMDGLEATRKIRETQKEIPIIALTANAFLIDRDSAMEAGCSLYLTKPIKKDCLEKTVSQFFTI